MKLHLNFARERYNYMILALMVLWLLFTALAVATEQVPQSTLLCAGKLSSIAKVSFSFEEHRVVTGRSSLKIIKALRASNKNGSLAGVRGPLPHFNLRSIDLGQTSLISLGEGNSNFIYRRITNRERRGLPIDDIHAVDRVYSDPDFYSEKWFLPSVVKMKGYIQKYPLNYVGTHLQDLDYGRRIEADEIISSNSFTYLLARQFRERDIKFIREHDLALFKRVLLHLKKGGVFRSWPVLSPPDLSKHLYIKEILDQLLNEGWITNHNFTMSVQPETTHSMRTENSYDPEIFLILAK